MFKKQMMTSMRNSHLRDRCQNKKTCCVKTRCESHLGSQPPVNEATLDRRACLVASVCTVPISLIVPHKGLAHANGHYPAAPLVSTNNIELINSTTTAPVSVTRILSVSKESSDRLDPDLAASSSSFPSISEALTEARAGDIIRIASGRYQERLFISKPVILEAFPPGSDAIVVWETNDPYEHTVEITSSSSGDSSQNTSDQSAGLTSSDIGQRLELRNLQRLELRNLRIEHYSKSVANNYAVYITSGSPLLEGCNIRSRSGTGVGIEGAESPVLQRCSIHECEGHGVAMFGSINDLSSSTDMEDVRNTLPQIIECDIYKNKQSGLLIRTGAEPTVSACHIHQNGGFGILLQDSLSKLEGNMIENNAQGALKSTSSAGLDLIDLNLISSQNTVKGRIVSV
ncbi:hypothetical protein CEUSTIGMA_g5336.t1 [Chlamydomonas eustigma]|uniref:Right handed beta helix domain-containing protein n=1 Tax=Chlamydomonas eustigma TaxID=1157962 RepID=A0A250X489_9CHLO|nr:hypothetical protein CEUSTIGMA_g5336.t1 [Chlamydomonas eustigma]|eukprot:GAX77894.1 hypothetical protein CEUSTIGMA_g5336.t1 [Chlamydomonas eustigma]